MTREIGPETKKDEVTDLGEASLSTEELQALLVAADPDFANVSREMIEEASKRVSKEGVLPKRALGITDGMMEGIYTQAYNMYKGGLYLDSSNIFRILLMLDYTDSRYLMGLAASLHMMKEYEAAAQLYLVTAHFEPDTPVPYFHAADCFMQLDRPTSARAALEFAIKIAERSPTYLILGERAKLMHEALAEASKQEMARPPGEASNKVHVKKKKKNKSKK